MERADVESFVGSNVKITNLMGTNYRRASVVFNGKVLDAVGSSDVSASIRLKALLYWDQSQPKGE